MDDYKWKTAVITLSDKGYRGEREDKSGPLICEMLPEDSYSIEERLLLPDEQEMIEKELIRLCDDDHMDLILTTGGTGFAQRDCTPEATLHVATRNAQGIADAMRYSSHSARHAKPGRIGDPGKDADHQSSGQHEGCQGKSLIHPVLLGARAWHPFRKGWRMRRCIE